MVYDNDSASYRNQGGTYPPQDQYSSKNYQPIIVNPHVPTDQLAELDLRKLNLTEKNDKV